MTVAWPGREWYLKTAGVVFGGTERGNMQEADGLTQSGKGSTRRRSRRALSHVALAAAFFFFVLAAPNRAAAGEKAAVDEKPSGLAYEVVINGAPDDDALALLQKVSQCESLKNDPPPSAFLLKGRIDEDVKSFEKVFNSLGFYAAKTSAEVKTDVAPARIIFTVDPGPQFLLSKVVFKLPEGETNRNIAFPDPKDLGLTLQAPARAKDILAAQDKLAEHFKQAGYPFAKVADRKVTANFENNGVTVEWLFDPGPEAGFGPTAFSGLTTVDSSVLQNKIPWKEGQPYDLRLINDYRASLTKLNLFSTINVKTDEEVDGKGRVPIAVTVIERKHRTIKGGVDYKSDEGPGVNLSWEHRNLFGEGERLYLAASASPIEQYAEAKFDKPFFLSPKQTLTTRLKYANEDKEAYKGWNAKAEANVRRDFTPDLSGAVGVGYRHSVIKEDKSRPWESEKEYHFAYIPMELTYDDRDDLLDPTKGFMASLALAPYAGVGEGPNFLRPEINLTHYLKILETPGVIFASRINWGADVGASLEELPSDLRYYAGGGGSIRGYPYQTVGPLRSKTPTGGESVFTFSAELRIRLNEYFGIVPFLDGGSAFSSALPPYDEKLLFGAGLGFRVYTPIGPIRLDLAVPLERRDNIDQIGQFYISIGQAF
jgi:translocation and assembly module TamA